MQARGQPAAGISNGQQYAQPKPSTAALRAVAKPITFTLKIWGAWQLVLLGKRVQLEQRQLRQQRATSRNGGSARW